jgi:hypothetical protein
MKNFLHLDYWAEVPAGKFLAGLSVEQRSLIIQRMHELGMYDRLSAHQLQLLESIRRKWSQVTDYSTEWFRTRTLTGTGNYNFPGVNMTSEENGLYLNADLMSAFSIESSLYEIPFETEVTVDQFYIARFPVTRQQYDAFNKGTAIDKIAGVLDSADEEGNGKRAQRVDPETSLRFCSEIGARLPTGNEWEKAARGVDGRLYPWGNEWDLEAGYFYYGQPNPHNTNNSVDSYPKGVSPFGVWNMAGGEPELITNIMANITSKGFHPKESSAASAWLDHIIPMPGRGNFVSLRPVLDKWPQQQWVGFENPQNRAHEGK